MDYEGKLVTKLLNQGWRSKFETGGGTISDLIFGGGHKTPFLTNPVSRALSITKV